MREEEMVALLLSCSGSFARNFFRGHCVYLLNGHSAEFVFRIAVIPGRSRVGIEDAPVVGVNQEHDRVVLIEHAPEEFFTFLQLSP